LTHARYRATSLTRPSINLQPAKGGIFGDTIESTASVKAPMNVYHPRMSKVRPSRKASSFTESVIREMTRLSNEHGAINLSQGFPDFAAPEEVKEAARQAISADINQYPITWGAERFRAAIADEYRTRYGMTWVDAKTNVTVTCGSTEAMIAGMLGVLDPGDEVVGSPRRTAPRPDAA
jgi:histidinol-phosphate/aromatic aminotransferase/cobyric acid decarboxylase-like protein